MEASTSQACVFILTTYDDGERNKFNDSTFRLRVPFKPNANKQYKVTINECLFHNNEPLLKKDEDYLLFTFHPSSAVYATHTEEFVMNTNVFVNSREDECKAIHSLIYESGVGADVNYLKRNNDPSRPTYIQDIKLYDENNTPYDYKTKQDQLKLFARLEITLTPIGKEWLTKYGNSISIQYSTNYGYLLNNLRSSELYGDIDRANGKCSFTFNNLRCGGPYLYVLKTPLKATVPTYNAINQGYNVVACVYNTVGYHNQVIQMSSSMEVVTRDLSNLRIELVNDQYEKVDIKSPMYIQITVSNAP